MEVYEYFVKYKRFGRLFQEASKELETNAIYEADSNYEVFLRGTSGKDSWDKFRTNEQNKDDDLRLLSINKV